MAKINGKEVNLLVDFGAMEILLKERGIDYMAETKKMYMALQEGMKEKDIVAKFNNLDTTKWLIYASAKRYAEENKIDFILTEDDLKKMSIFEYMTAEVEVTAMVVGGDVGPEELELIKKQTSPKNAKRRS